MRTEPREIQLPTNVIDGSKTGISDTASQISTTSTPIYKVIVIKVQSLGTGSYIAIGNATSQSFRLQSVGAAISIDFIDNLNKIYCITDSGNTGILEYLGG